MVSTDKKRVKGETLLDIKGLKIDGYSDDVWSPIVKGIDLTLKRGEVLGLIGESGAGKSTLGLAAMGFARPGCRISGGSIIFDGMDLIAASEEQRRALWGSRIAYVAQSAAASFNPAHHIIDQTVETAVAHNIMTREKAEADARAKRSPDSVDWYFSRTGLPRKPAPRAKAPKKRPSGK